ncbi:MAG: hypothetical protein C0439_10635 [Pseudomonas sp.]|nr:hypothetical protein [Pseudomonas sp.]
MGFAMLNPSYELVRIQLGTPSYELPFLSDDQTRVPLMPASAIAWWGDSQQKALKLVAAGL